jgi:hypothetical protein
MEAGTYNLAVRSGNRSKGGAVATHSLDVNGRSQGAVRYEYAGEDSWSNVVLRVKLVPGANKVRFTKGDGMAEIDCIDVFPARPVRRRRRDTMRE